MDTLEETTPLDSMRGVWGGEAVDQLDHGLQSAKHAVDDGADDALVLASALHDLGHSPWLGFAPDYPHDRAAREWLTPRFGARAGWLAGAHVAAKRYLVATEPAYAATLSGVSVVSLAHQGGAFVDPSFTDHEWWPDALRLRRYDDAAKTPGAPAVSIADVLAVAQRLALRAGR